MSRSSAIAESLGSSSGCEARRPKSKRRMRGKPRFLKTMVLEFAVLKLLVVLGIATGLDTATTKIPRCPPGVFARSTPLTVHRRERHRRSLCQKLPVTRSSETSGQKRVRVSSAPPFRNSSSGPLPAKMELRHECSLQFFNTPAGFHDASCRMCRCAEQQVPELVSNNATQHDRDVVFVALVPGNAGQIVVVNDGEAVANKRVAVDAI